MRVSESSSSKADPQVLALQYSTAQHTHQTPGANTVSAVIAPLPYAALTLPYQTTSTPLRPIALLPLIHTRALSICDFFLRLSDHGNAHCPSATRVYDTFELSELCSWIALHQLQPALDTTHPPYTASRLDSAASHTRTRPQ